VLGPSGAGKTTLFRCLTGSPGRTTGRFKSPAATSGKAPRELRLARRELALIFQQFN